MTYKFSKIAICHDRLTNLGGGERVAITLAKNLNADLYVSEINKSIKEWCKEVNIKTLSHKFGGLPILNRIVDAYNFYKLDLSKYNVVISSGNWSCFARHKNHIWYCHTPLRISYDLKQEFLKKQNLFQRQILNCGIYFWRFLNKQMIKKIKKIIVNSKNIQKRIKKYFKRESTIIYPPINLKKFKIKKIKKKNEYFLSVQRIVPHKRIELQISIFKRIPNKKLLIIGGYEKEDRYVKKIKTLIKQTPNIIWKKNITEQELIKCYYNCYAVIQTSMDEDFGMVPLEAMACGKPCLAVNEGGFKETVINKKTGLLIEKPYIKNFIKVIDDFESYKFNENNSFKRAKEFSEQKFIKRIKKEILNLKTQSIKF